MSDLRRSRCDLDAWRAVAPACRLLSSGSLVVDYASARRGWEKPEATLDDAKLIEKLRLIEALFAGATTPGEREAAAEARERIPPRLQGLKAEDPEVEYRFTLGDTDFF